MAILVSILVVAATLVTALVVVGSQAVISGVVRDGMGVGISDAVVSGGLGNAKTDPTGHYEIKVLKIGRVVLIAEAEGHWAQKIEITGQTDLMAVDFNLINDVESAVPIGAIFFIFKKNTTLNGTVTVYTNPEGSARTIGIEDLADSNERDYLLECGAMEPRTGWVLDLAYINIFNWTSSIFMQRVIVSGVYSSTGEVENCYVKGVISLSYSFEVTDMQDYLDANNHTETFTFTPEGAGPSITNMNHPQHTYHLPSSLGVQVNAEILGSAFNCTLPVFYYSVDGGKPYAYYTIWNDDPGTTTSLAEFEEGGNILHLWEVDL